MKIETKQTCKFCVAITILSSFLLAIALTLVSELK